MKTNKMMRIASVMLVAALLSTCAISGTFAKYVTTQNAEDSARVAYWGLDKEATVTFDLFATAYDNEAVKSSTEDNVVAPGTAGEATFSFVTAKDATQAPEVAYEFEVKVEGEIGTNLINELVFTLDNGEDMSFTQLKDAIAKLADPDASTVTNSTVVKTYGAGEVPAAFENGQTHTIKWSWAYAGGDDAADTELGNATFADLEEVNLKITVTATQVDSL